MPLERTDKQLNAVLVQLWQKLKPEQQFQKLPPKKGPHMNQLLSLLPFNVRSLSSWTREMVDIPPKNGAERLEAPCRVNHPLDNTK